MILASHIVGVLEMTDEQIKLLSKKKLYERIFATMNAHHTDEHLALVAERSRRAGFDIDQTLECVIEAAQREKYLSYVDIPDQLARPWSERRYQFPGHLQDLILHCHAKKFPLLSSIIVEKKNVDSGVMGEKSLSGFAGGAETAGYEIGNKLAFLKEQQNLTFAHAKASPRIQRSFLITWKESGWPISELEALLTRWNANRMTIEPWRMQSHQQCAVGDRVYALKQGDGPKVIFGVGEIVGDTSQQEWKGQFHWMAPIRFERLVHPLQKALIDEAHARQVLSNQLIRYQASGVGISKSTALQLDALIIAKEQAAADWTEHELDRIVPAYFEMLKAEVAGEPYNKSEHRSELLAVISRSPGAIEFKHQDISAILNNLGKRWIKGYKPQAHIQAALAEKVERYLMTHPNLDDEITPTETEKPALDDIAGVFEAAPTSKGQSHGSSQGQTSVNGGNTGYNAAERDAANKKLGNNGEGFVIRIERIRLEALRLTHLAEKVEWVAMTKGDGEGYDVLSFDEEGNELWIEVKTTNGPKKTPFYITKRELEVAKDHADKFRIYRVFRFRTGPKVYVINPPLEKEFDLEPISWRVWPR